MVNTIKYGKSGNPDAIASLSPIFPKKIGSRKPGIPGMPKNTEIGTRNSGQNFDRKIGIGSRKSATSLIGTGTKD